MALFALDPNRPVQVSPIATGKEQSRLQSDSLLLMGFRPTHPRDRHRHVVYERFVDPHRLWLH